MKKLISFLSALIIVLLFSKTQAQSDISGVGTGHIGVSPYYVGWDNTTSTIDLDIKHNYIGKNINFWTTDGSGTNQRMTILDNGNVGIGTAFTNPMNLLHLNVSDATSVFTQWTNSTTGAGAANGFRFFQNSKAYIERCSS